LQESDFGIKPSILGRFFPITGKAQLRSFAFNMQKGLEFPVWNYWIKSFKYLLSYWQIERIEAQVNSERLGWISEQAAPFVLLLLLTFACL